jgi:hypothetical protein
VPACDGAWCGNRIGDVNNLEGVLLNFACTWNGLKPLELDLLVQVILVLVCILTIN